MIQLQEAIKQILDSGKIAETEEIHLSRALNRVLAEDIYSDVDIPSFHKSAVDGFAIQSASLNNPLKLLEFVPAGSLPHKKIGPNECSRVMTGGMIPEGADMVIMLEHTEELPDGKISFTKEKTKSNILYTGEDLKKGEKVLEKGIRLQPAHIGILAGAGITRPKVYSPPRVAIISTGTELVEPSEFPEPPFIRNTNSYHIQALCLQEGVQATNEGILADDPEVITGKIKELLDTNEIVIFTGGASFGDHDFSKQVMENLGADIRFNKLAIQPGKPVLFATIGHQYLFGLSGNPVSSSVQFLLLVKPLLHQIMGIKEGYRIKHLPMVTPFSRKKAERALFFPVQITNDSKVLPVNYNGSAHLNAFEKADALACFPIGQTELKKGEIVHVRSL